MNNQPLNIPTIKDQFEKVSFVEDMSNYQLKVLVKRIWDNLQKLSNSLDKRSDDVSKVLDTIMDGKKWDEKQLKDRYVYTNVKGIITRFDRLTNETVIMNDNLESIDNPIKGITLTEYKEQQKALKKNKSSTETEQ